MTFRAGTAPCNWVLQWAVLETCAHWIDTLFKEENFIYDSLDEVFLKISCRLGNNIVININGELAFDMAYVLVEIDLFKNPAY